MKLRISELHLRNPFTDVDLYTRTTFDAGILLDYRFIRVSVTLDFLSVVVLSNNESFFLALAEIFKAHSVVQTSSADPVRKERPEKRNHLNEKKCCNFFAGLRSH